MIKVSITSLLLAALFATSIAGADETPAFDRPGIAFSPSTLPQGGISWEQGLPDFSTDRSGGERNTSWVADSLLRFGLPQGMEIQLGADTYGGVITQGNGVHSHESSGGDGRAGIKWAPSPIGPFAVAILGTGTLPFGKAPVGGGGHDYDVGVTGSWSLPANTSVSMYADRSWGDEGRGWLLSPSYGFPVGSTYGGYVEAGYGTGSAYTRVAGGGFTYMVNARLQLDASFLRGLTGKSPDWQGGFGVAWYIH